MLSAIWVSESWSGAFRRNDVNQRQRLGSPNSGQRQYERARFDLIFTLNQDLLLECHYLERRIDLSPQRKFDAVRMPGMKEFNPQPHIGPVSALHAKWTPQAGKFSGSCRLRRLRRFLLGPAAAHHVVLPCGTISHVSRGVREPVD
jgi:hypothetical protein